MVMPNIKKFIDLCTGANEKNAPDPNSVKQTMINRFALGIIVPILSILFFPNAQIIIGFIIYLIISCAMRIALNVKSVNINIILLSGIILDMSMSVYISMISAADMAIIYPIYIWSILGIGFRFGNRWLFIASFFAIIAFGSVIYTQPYWHQNPSFSISLLVSLFVIPAYCSILIRKLSYAKEKAEAANRAKSYFLASVSHELRTPLNAIIGYGTHLSDMNLSPSQLKMVNSSVAAGQYLLQLIEQLLQLGKSQTQSEEVELSEFKITDLLLESRNILAGRAQEKGLEILIQSEADCQGIYHGPENDIKNLILNITSNAIKFTDSGKIVIRSSIEKSNNGINLLLSITDTGIGIDQQAIGKIFEPFQQADETIMDRFGGTGLGLAICKQIIDKLNGSISIDSKIDQGSTFKLSVPLVSKITDPLADENSESSLIRILSLGRQKEDMLLKAQSSGNYYISHRECNSVDDIKKAIDDSDLDDFDIAIFDHSMVGDLESRDPFWQIFKQSSVACILMSEDEDIDIHKIGIQCAFASILSPATSFDQFRKAVSIGTSFVDKDMVNFDTLNRENIDHENIGRDAIDRGSSNGEASNGELSAQNADHNGTRAGQVSAQQIPKPENMITILVVDDNRTNRMVLESILTSQNYIVDLANDGVEALDKLEGQTYDIMLIDVNMPRMNGIEATRLWRAMENSDNRLPIVGVTADATKETLEKCMAAGMNERVTKPVEAKSLIAKVKHYCANGANNRANSALLNQESKAPDPAPPNMDNRQIATAMTECIDGERIKYLESIGDGDFIRLVINSYIDETQQIAQTFYNGNNPCDHEQFRFAVHAIKGSANNIGAYQLSQICSQYENLSDHEYALAAQNTIGIITTELAKVEKNIIAVREFYRLQDQPIQPDLLKQSL